MNTLAWIDDSVGLEEYPEEAAALRALSDAGVRLFFMGGNRDFLVGERLLAHCGLEFEDGCLRFYENDRAVRTASSEQVRRPIFKDAVEHWRAYEP